MSTLLTSLRTKIRAPGEPFSMQSLSGTLSELSGPAVLTAAMLKVREAQRAAEPVAWVSHPDSIFYAPDVEESGIDLEAIAVICVPGADAPRAGEMLVRNGGFGLVVIDLQARANIQTPLLSRMLGLAQKHEVAVLFLTQRGEHDGSLDSLIAMRAWATAPRTAPGEFTLTVKALKDKRHAPNWSTNEVCRGPAGLR